MQIVNTNVTAGFATNSTSTSITLEEDTAHTLSPIIQKLRGNDTVAYNGRRAVKMFASPSDFSGIQVVAVTGSLAYRGMGVDTGKSQLLTFSPSSREQQLPPGVINVTLETVGRAFTEKGAATTVSFTFDAVKRVVRCSASAFAFCTIRYSQNYYSYEYTFSGSCPLNQSDVTGHEFEQGSIYALYSSGTVVANASLNMTPPRCDYQSMLYSYNDTAAHQQMPTISMSVDPWGPARLISADSGRIAAEGLFRIYDGGAGSSIGATSGWYWGMQDYQSEEITDVLIFNNTPTASLSRVPAGGVSLSVASAYSSVGAVVGPGSTITDVTWTGTYSYTNPKNRKVGATEVVVTDSFGKAVKTQAVVYASYVTEFSRNGYGFEYDYNNERFMPGYLFAKTNDGRSASMQMTPPTNGTTSRGWR